MRALPSLYDDGGYSGGSMERPALQRLLQDVEIGRVNVIVVYKVDRLTRSLADFDYRPSERRLSITVQQPDQDPALDGIHYALTRRETRAATTRPA